MQPRITSGPLTGRGPEGTWYLMKHVVADDHAAPIISGPLLKPLVLFHPNPYVAMNSICFYQPSQMMTVFSDGTTRSPFICNRPPLMPIGCGRQHTSWDGALECVEVMEILNLTSREGIS